MPGSELLNRQFEDLLELLVDDSERMTAKRQATPFAGVLEPAKRWAIYARFERRGAGTLPAASALLPTRSVGY
jgi:hypothetical protein